MDSLKRRSDASQPPCLSWCIISRNSAAKLEATLKSLRERTPDAEIVIVDTMSSDDSPAIGQRYADVWVEYTGPKGTWTREMYAFDDAAAARQHSFELASGKWRAWVDTDDVLPGPEEVERLLKLNNQWHPPGNGAQEVAGPPTTLEDLLAEVEKLDSTIDCIWAPYLYRRDEAGIALQWQERERIVKWRPGAWRWSEAAHEVLVPVNHVPKYVSFTSLLFVHEKDFTQDDMVFSVKRHGEIMLHQYESGDRTCRRSLYLAKFAVNLYPEREEEFALNALELAETDIDRSRSYRGLASLRARQGRYFDAMEGYRLATMYRPELPDAWLEAGELAFAKEDYSRAVTLLESAKGCIVGSLESDVSPRDSVLKISTLLAESYRAIARQQRSASFHQQALDCFTKAFQLLHGVRENPAVGSDKEEAGLRLLRCHNEMTSQQQAIRIGELCQYLMDNDEPAKALGILHARPWNCEDHPILVEYERKLAPVATHELDHDAYVDFYENKTETGAMATPEHWLDPKNPDYCHPLERAKWIGAWITQHKPTATVLDVGCFDGIVGIPLMRLCPAIRYYGVDMFSEAISRFSERINAMAKSGDDSVVPQELKVVRGFGDIQGPDADGDARSIYRHDNKYDVIIWSEVIEHVQDPADDLRQLASMLKPGGRLFVTTPWGAFDLGNPPPSNCFGGERGNRGHLRVMTMKDVLEAAPPILDVETLCHVKPPIHIGGDEMRIEMTRSSPESRLQERLRAPQLRTDVNFYVPSALWNWNGTTIHEQGMGASEETIAYLARELAQNNQINVYGPVPDEEVHRRVRYWNVAKLRHVDPKSTIVVSRSPSSIIALPKSHKGKKVLWLQDAWYSDLPEYWSQYDVIVVVSEWHKQAMHDRHQVPLDKMVVSYNFLMPEHFKQSVPRKNDHFLYASSPDRGVNRLLEWWPDIKKQLPDATLEILYGWKGAEKLGILSGGPSWRTIYPRERAKFEKLIAQPGVTYRGLVNHWQVAESFLHAGVWAYPTHFEETCCTNAIKARAGGAVPVCPPLAALAETAQGGIFAGIDDKAAFIDKCVNATCWDDNDRAAMGLKAIADHSVSRAMADWKEILR